MKLFSKNNNFVKDAVPIILVVAIIVGFILTIVWLNKKSASSPESAEKIQLAQCLKEKGVKMYGAFWCSHCQAQKTMFGTAAWKELDYVECSPNNDRRAIAQECKDANISGYPTWVFPDSSRLQGEQELKLLSEKAGCNYLEK